jgi:hypothetical protein
MLRTDYLETNPAKSSFLVNNPSKDINEAKETAGKALPKSGGTMTGDIAMGGKKVSGLGAPIAESDAATKDYVDKRKATSSVTLSASAWSNKTQTVSVPGVTADNTVLVTPAPNSYVAYGEAVVYCSAQGSGTLTFTCDEVPTADLTVNVLIMN